MHITARAYWAPKAGNRLDEYEDAFWPADTARRVARRKGARARFAVADGATETSFAGLWARRLVAAYGAGCFNGVDWVEQLRREQAAWYGEVLQRPLPWYAEDKVREGAYAALLGLELSAAGDWQGLAVGDCCLLQWRGDELVTAFPAQEASFFTSRPYLLSSNAARNTGLGEQSVRAAGRWQPGDRFALLSDAIAHWALAESEAGHAPLAALAAVQRAGQRHFVHWVESLRTTAALRNDDVTALLLTVAG